MSANTNEQNNTKLKPEAVEAFELLGNLDKAAEEVKKRLEAVLKEIKKIEKESASEDAGPHAGELNRLKFKRIGVTFYVDFALAATGDEMALEGKVIYGALRSAATENDIKYKLLFECPVSKNGLIKDPGGIKGQWIIKQDKSNFADVHFLILQNIWKDALNWSNDYPTD